MRIDVIDFWKLNSYYFTLLVFFLSIGNEGYKRVRFRRIRFSHYRWDAAKCVRAYVQPYASTENYVSVCWKLLPYVDLRIKYIFEAEFLVLNIGVKLIKRLD